MTRVQATVQTQMIPKPTFTPRVIGASLRGKSPHVVDISRTLLSLDSDLYPAGQSLPTARSPFTSSRFGHDFSGIRVRPVQPGKLQTSLLIGKPRDPYEQEADSIADSIISSPRTKQGSLQRPTASIGWGAFQRFLDESADASSSEDRDNTRQSLDTNATENEEAAQVAQLLLETDNMTELTEQPASPSPLPASDEAVQAQELPGQTPIVSPKVENGIAALRGQSGQHLAASTRAFFEPRFGHDFSHVRIHTSKEASRLARSVRARAFTVGHDIFFGEEHYAPQSLPGQWLIAHELTHVLQQQSGLARSADKGIKVQSTGQPQIQGGFWGSLWGGIKKGASTAWGGIKWAAGKVSSGVKTAASASWQAVKWASGKVWSGIKRIGSWGWNVLKSGAALAWSWAVNSPQRVWRLIKHLGSGIAGSASWLWQGLKLAWQLDLKGMGEWLLDGILSGAAWVGRLIGKLVDIAGVGEIWDLVFQIIKVNTRPLTAEEKSEAQKTFKNSIAYWKVRVDQFSLLAYIGSLFRGGGGMGVTTFHTINFNQKIKASPGSDDMHWLTHELTHVSQYEHAGSQYLGEALHAQFFSKAKYDYKPHTDPLWRPATHPSPNMGGMHFREFNREQQGQIAADYYFSLYGIAVPSTSGTFTPITSDYEPVIDELRSGDI